MPTRKLNSQEVKSARKLLKIVEEFRSINPDMPIKQVAIFLGVLAGDGEATLSSLSSHLDVAQSTASKNLAQLAGVDRLHPLPNALIEMHENPAERRSKIISLTQPGWTLTNKLLKHVGE